MGGEDGLDPATLAAAAATALIAAMTTDAWQKTCSAVASLWRRAHPNRADTVTAELVEVRQKALLARQLGNLEIEEGLVTEWEQRLRRLLEGDPDAAPELQRVLEDVLHPALDRADQQRLDRIVMRARASGHGRVYQAGRDMYIRRNGGDSDESAPSKRKL